ncbi:phosphoadenosine phosphosulfate reductase domain-containing protein [Sharpea azabuensis]|uniref:phosphoadenosine phosphosulfate reductase domain-containing protein n=1 Tax=Sharpea azabuensis TaxID=322505 RepID=UPI001933BC47|nr:phosphoadenosine phosphosulfate reductase family protein [Sharpea azabuensis]
MTTTKKICPVCGNETEEDRPIEIYWCDECKTPVIKEIKDSSKAKCNLCGNTMKYMATDMRPVFPEEILLLELLLEKKPGSLQKSSIWASNHRYFIDGKVTALHMADYYDMDVNKIVEGLKKYKDTITYDYFNNHMENFINANKDRLNYIIDEASEFIRSTSAKYDRESIVISFSGGKDSTVTADLVTKALSDPSLVHIFGNTTLEFPSTIEYANRFRKNHPYAIFQIAENKEQNFNEVCKEIGPPARMMRWCCSMFKTGPITRVLNSMYGDEQVLTFYGIRKSESVSRSKYNRIEKNTGSVKIQKQTVASPIFFWRDIDIWLYMLAEEVDFNDAYRYGYDRVGCWMCPNNNKRAMFLSKIYMPERSEAWRDYLIDFAKSIGKPDPEKYVDEGSWKARQGGNGLAAADDVKIRFTNCTTEDNAKIYKLVRPFDDELVGMFVPFGRLAPELGRKLLNETIVLDVRTNVPILSIQPFSQDGYEYAVKVRTMNVENHEDLQRKVAYQIRKFNACKKCLKCESVCRHGAIHVTADGYYIDASKCVHCKMCVNQKYLRGGCMMDKYLRTKD